MSHIGKNVKRWRLARKLGLNELARLADVDRGNLSNLEKGKVGISVDKLMTLARVLKVPAGLLIDEGGNDSLPVAGSGRRIRVIPWSRIADWKQTITATEDEFMHVTTEIPCSADTFAIVVRDESMAPDLREGDLLVVDPNVVSLPGKLVVALDAKSEAFVRIYRDLGLDHKGKAAFELAPVNGDFAVKRSDREPLELIGTVVQSRRNFLSTK